jgi:hypothetical protein
VISPVVVDAVGAISAAAVTGAAGYVSIKAREVANRIERAHELAEENRELIAGDPDAGSSLFDRVMQIERDVYGTDNQHKEDD